MGREGDEGERMTEWEDVGKGTRGHSRSVANLRARPICGSEKGRVAVFVTGPVVQSCSGPHRHESCRLNSGLNSIQGIIFADACGILEQIEDPIASYAGIQLHWGLNLKEPQSHRGPLFHTFSPGQQMCDSQKHSGRRVRFALSKNRNMTIIFEIFLLFVKMKFVSNENDLNQ